MKIVVTGDRNWVRFVSILDEFERLLETHDLQPEDITVIHGDCRGLDRMAAKLAEALGMTVIPYPANWEKYGRAAGPIRNQQMLDENPDIEKCLAFHDNLEGSRGTKDMVNRCAKKNIITRISKKL